MSWILKCNSTLFWVSGCINCGKHAVPTDEDGLQIQGICIPCWLSQVIVQIIKYTGSFRKNVKSKMFVKISIFTKKSVFSTVSGQKLAANLCPTASKSTRITPWYPWKLAPLICFQTVVGWLRQTIDLRLSAKTPTMCLSSQGEKSAILTYLSPFTLLILSFTNWNTNFGSLLRV